RMDGIANVWTDEDVRKRGFSRQVMEAMVDHMRHTSDAGLSVLYGIRDYYPKFGFATQGSDQTVELAPADDEPDGAWRQLTAADLPGVQAVYEAASADVCGAAIRRPDADVWRRMLDQPDQCLVHGDPIDAYIWRGKGCWPVDVGERVFWP